MSRFREVIEADDQRGADPQRSEQSERTPARRDISPFSMNYETESFNLDAATTDRMLSVLIAVTNLM